ncbi:MAG: hypothetical protein WBV11_15465 [Salegentibacter sp.]
MKIIRLNLILLLLCSTAGIMAQSTKLNKTYNTAPNVAVNIDATHTNIVVERWDKNQVQVEAVLNAETKDKAKLQELLKSWNLDTRATNSQVKITSSGGIVWNAAEMDLSSLQEPLSKLPEIIEPVMNHLVAPILKSMSEHPLPPQFSEDMGDMDFDYEAYQKEGDKYMERYEEKMHEKFGKNFEKSMEEWAANFEKDSAVWKEDFEKSMEKWGEDFGASMEKWGDSFGKNMEEWAHNLEKQMEEKYGDDDEDHVIVVREREARAKKTIKLKLPRNAKLDLNVRHGEVKLSGETSDLKANLSHGKLTADVIKGEKTNIRAAYSPVKVKSWQYGVLDASYVENLNLDKVESIKLTSNSSDVTINEIGKTGILSGNFGQLEIKKLSPGFSNLNISLKNSDLKLSLPEAAYQFSYNGNQSNINYPEGLKVKSSKSYDNLTLTGYNKSKGADASISIDASFSELLLN